MSEAHEEIVMIPIDAIQVLNPRKRNKRIFEELVDSISKLGLKKPITVTPASKGGFSLVCGQGRLEAFIELKQERIPAIVIEVSREDSYILSLVENMARRNHSPLELIREVGALRNRGYNNQQVADKIGFSNEYVSMICTMLDRGEERLLNAVERGMIPHSVAYEIVMAGDTDTQSALAEAYEKGLVTISQIVKIRRILDERSQIGKTMRSARGSSQKGLKPTATSLVRVYQKEVQRQKLLVKKASLAQSRLLFVVNAMKKLLSEEHFVTLLRAESMGTLPLPLAERIGISEA
ncbi:plasmid partitioning protein RepB C-terminal domain-containing protein (plasmid) [Sphingobium sp. SJ10-10]|uniref:ParB/RepB/Spo0J family partition protein n=1 Tax=Sphingobium sp. SJ10-10 TaxID=3114999 RepID=UPI002E18DF70|nr:plasmid partitioning protein RepB C-terminal domain-containing protein [Sphingobium sp. SJ10-10]